MRPRTGAELFLLVLLFLLAKFNKFLQLTINLEPRSYIKHLEYRKKIDSIMNNTKCTLTTNFINI